MNIAHDLTATVIHVAGYSFIAAYLLSANLLKWTGLIVAYPISIWILGAATSNSSIILVVVNRLAMALACVYVVIALLALLKNRRRVVVGSGQLNIAGHGFYTMPEPESKIDKIGRFLSDEKLIQFNSLINQFLMEKKPFLQHKYSLSKLAGDVHIPVNYLSAFINRYHKMNYSDFINRYRVFQSKEMIMNGEWKYKTLEAIASEAGFNNRNTFTAAFKKETGQSPSEFLKRIKKDQPGNRALSNKKRILV
jgi:AraC-like DNA-binding protein